MALRILCLGDIVGRPGRQVVHAKLPALVKQRQIDLVIANAENIAGGSGITQNLFNKIRSYGIDVATLGDHAFRKNDIIPTLQASERIVRPANLASSAAGRPFTVVPTNKGVSVGVFCLLGRIYMNLPADDPHPHEGGVGKPSDDPTARVVVTGTSQATQRPFNIAVAFDAAGGNGPGWAESTFHHFCDYNWDTSAGCPSFVGERPSDAIAKNPSLLDDTKAYVRNLVTWLGRRPR